MKKIITTLLLLIFVVRVMGNMPAMNFPNGVSFSAISASGATLNKKIKMELPNGDSSKWFSYSVAMNALFGSFSAEYNTFLFPDSTVLVNYGSSTGSPYIHEIGNIFDLYSNNLQQGYNSSIVPTTTPYIIDSMGLTIGYSRHTSNNIVDTLLVYLFQAAPNSSDIPTYYYSNELANYGVDTVFVPFLLYNYTTNSLADKKAPITTVKILLTEADTSTVKSYTKNFALPTSIKVVAGNVVACAITFKPGYTYTTGENVDSFANIITFVSLDENPGGYPLYIPGDNNNVSSIVENSVRYNDGGYDGLFIPSFAYGSSYTFDDHRIFYHTIYPPLDNTLTIEPQSPVICLNSGITLDITTIGSSFTWSPSIGLSATTGSSVVASPTVTTTYTVTGLDSHGFNANDTLVVTVNPIPTITATAFPTSYCPGGSSTFTALGGSTYTWSPATNLSATMGATVTTTVETTTTYTVTGTGANGCTNAGTVTVAVNSTAAILATAFPSSYCLMGSSYLTASGGITYTWSPSTGLNSTTGSMIIASPTVTTTYTVDGSSGAGCMGTTTVTVTINPTPNKPYLTQNGNTLTSSAVQNNQWSRNDTVLQGAISQTYSVSILGCYSVTVTDIGDSCSSTSDATCISTLSGINHLTSSSNQLSIFPNPTSNSATVNFSLAESSAQLALLNVLGQVVYTKTLTPFSGNNYNSSIDLTNQPSGMYNICIKTSTEIINAKIVKQY